MSMRDVRVRPLQGSDLPVMTSIHLEAFQGYRSALLGPRFVGRLYQWFLIHPDAFGLVAELAADNALDGGDLCGFAVGAPLGSGPDLTRFTAATAVQALVARPWLLMHPEIRAAFRLKLRQMRRPAPALACLPGGPALRTAALVGIGVAARLQGHGVGARLMEAFEAEAIWRGYRRACLGVRRDNAAACHLYRRCGWEEWPLLRTPNAATYVKLLAPERVTDPGAALGQRRPANG
jgi:ribosomal protein S18 acetylase RimI-like enzyme